MPIIKLDAIDSTNDFLKQLYKDSPVEDFTIVMANSQTNGKGQMGEKWISDSGKNLTMSILVKGTSLHKNSIFDFNIAVALAILKVLKNCKIPNTTIKWPNDIMSDSKKVAGILIENILKANDHYIAIVGIGLNLNQNNFSHLPQATSLANITGEFYELEDMAILLKNSLKEQLITLSNNSQKLWDEYHENLFKINYPSPFEDKGGKRFMGIIKQVDFNGKLKVLLDEDDSIVYFEVKEVKLLY